MRNVDVLTQTVLVDAIAASNSPAPLEMPAIYVYTHVGVNSNGKYHI